MPTLTSMVQERYILAAALILFILSILFLWFKFRKPRPSYPFQIKPVLSEAEKAFYHVLTPIVPRGTILLSKVRLADFLEVIPGTENRLGHFGRISQKHTDFLLIDTSTAEPLLAIELDDSTHRRNARTMESDEMKNNAYAAAGLPILRIRAARRYDSRKLERAVHSALKENTLRE